MEILLPRAQGISEDIHTDIVLLQVAILRLMVIELSRIRFSGQFEEDKHLGDLF